MPQLDLLTYFHQYVYLVITFVAVYLFVLSFIIPKMVSALKIRRKLNSLNQLSSKLNPHVHIEQQKTGTSFNPLLEHYDHLLMHNWKAMLAKKKKDWLDSTRAVQLCQTLKLKKLFAHSIIRKITWK